MLSWSGVFSARNGGAVVVVGGPQPMAEVAVSFPHFLKAYLTHPARLFRDLREDDHRSERTVA